MKLSILIATLDSRKEQFDRLVSNLLPQCPDDQVQVAFMRDRGQADGGLSIGDKRQQLLEQAVGDFVVFIDDDDEIAPDYVESILPHLKDGVDCIGFEIDCYGYVPGRVDQCERAAVSSRYKEWANDVDGYRYVRCPHHLVPVRREHALAAGFAITSKYGEDAGYSFRLRDLGLLRNEVFIPKVLYTIRHNPSKTFGS